MSQRAQTALELGIFGSILLFVIGMIAQQGLFAGLRQNQNLRALRWAMTMSARYSQGLEEETGTDDPTVFGRSSRNVATVMLIEDRLSSSFARFASIDRIPSITTQSATLSNNLMYSADPGEKNQTPVFDLFINGKHFVFTTAGEKTVCLARYEKMSDPGASNNRLMYDHCEHDADADGVIDIPYDEWIGTTALAHPLMTPNLGPADNPAWDPNCATYFAKEILSKCIPSDCNALCVNAIAPYAGCTVNVYLAGGEPLYKIPEPLGCVDLYSKAVKADEGEWCNGTLLFPCPGGNLSSAERFDLDRLGGDDVTNDIRDKFSWQWFRVMAFDEQVKVVTGKDQKGVYLERYPIGGGGAAHYGQFVHGDPVDGIDILKDGKNSTVDVDYDGKTERILNVVERSPLGVIIKVLVSDGQEGDLDFTQNDYDVKILGQKIVGLQSSAKMYTKIDDGKTYLRIEEGKLWGDDRQLVRSASFKDQVDFIERKIQLSSDTHRFCKDGVPVRDEDGLPGYTPGEDIEGVGLWTDDVPNPVETCCDTSGCCDDAGNKELTCMDLSAADGKPVIYVRSIISDIRGHKWVTEATTW